MLALLATGGGTGTASGQQNGGTNSGGEIVVNMEEAEMSGEANDEENWAADNAGEGGAMERGKLGEEGEEGATPKTEEEVTIAGIGIAQRIGGNCPLAAAITPIGTKLLANGEEEGIGEESAIEVEEEREEEKAKGEDGRTAGVPWDLLGAQGNGWVWQF